VWTSAWGPNSCRVVPGRDTAVAMAMYSHLHYGAICWDN
jgi:hypothetical protein